MCTCYAYICVRDAQCFVCTRDDDSCGICAYVQFGLVIIIIVVVVVYQLFPLFYTNTRYI